MQHEGSIGNRFRIISQRFGASNALDDPDQSLTYGDLNDAVMKLILKLQQTGLKRNDHIGIYFPSSVDYIIAYLAVVCSGMVAVPLDTTSSEEIIRFIARDANLKAVVTRRSSLDKLDKILQTNIPVSQVCFLICPDEINITLTTKERKNVFHDNIKTGDLAAIMYTTGTTSLSKGVMLTHNNILSALSNISQFVGYKPDDCELITLPLSHNFGLNHVLCNVLNGGSVYILPGLGRLKFFFHLMETQRFTGCPSTPAGYGLLMDRYEQKVRLVMRQLRFIIIDSAPLPPSLAIRLMQTLPTTDILVYYGLTEASRSTFIRHSLSRPDLLTSVGKASPNVDVKILGEDGTFLTAGQEGEVVVQASAVTDGYWNRPVETKHSFHKSWFRTGDVGYLNKDGYLFLSGRLKDIINIGGLKVNPAEINDLFCGMVEIKEFQAIGLPSKTLAGEEIVGFVAFHVGRQLPTKAIQEFAARKVEPYKIPGRIIILDKLPRSETGKVLTGELRKIALTTEKDNDIC